MQSLSPLSHMAARHGTHTVVISGYWKLITSDVSSDFWWHRVTHSEIRSTAWIPSIESMLLHRQIRWLGHVTRMPTSRLPHCVLYVTQWCPTFFNLSVMAPDIVNSNPILRTGL